jgi:aerobic-type carbon monoxide dehydrogenase small subunit (CoxS/CutS family)
VKINVTINGSPKEIEISPHEKLLDVLRRQGYLGVKYGCGRGECGTCTVILDGRAVKSCITFAAQADGRSVVTVEGIGQPDHLHPIQEAILDHGASQCGYCTSGIICSAKALLDENPHPTEAEVRQALKGNLCRCTGYDKYVQAILDAAQRIERGRSGAGGME